MNSTEEEEEWEEETPDPKTEEEILTLLVDTLMWVSGMSDSAPEALYNAVGAMQRAKTEEERKELGRCVASTLLWVLGREPENEDADEDDS